MRRGGEKCAPLGRCAALALGDTPVGVAPPGSAACSRSGRGCANALKMLRSAHSTRTSSGAPPRASTS
jgi:hypothetical protein